MLSQIISMGQFNWQTGVACVTANLCSQQLLAKIALPDDNIPYQNEITAFFIGSALVAMVAKPLQNYFSIPIRMTAIVPISLFLTIVQVVSKILFPQKVEAPVKVKPQEETPAKPQLNNLHDLVSYFNSKWDADKNDYVGIEYDPERVKKNLEACTLAKIDSHVDYRIHHGFIEKKEVPKGSKVFVRADLHGDLKSLLENLKAMKKEGLLDENFKCKPGTYMVFCGDYMDRGNHSIEIAEVLAILQAENPDQVSIIRGNHEYLETNRVFYSREDENFIKFFKDHQVTLLMFYQKMPLAVYLAEEGGEYVDLAHGLFELHIDPSEMLDSDTTSRMYIPKAPQEFSERVQKLAAEATPIRYNWLQHLIGYEDHEPSKTQLAAKRIMELKAVEFDRKTEDTTAYNWGDIRSTPPALGPMGARQWHIRPEEVKDALRLMGNVRKVKLVFRGHQHLFLHAKLQENGKIVATTLPVGADTGFYNKFHPFNVQLDRAYILDVNEKVKDWEKHAFLRKSGETKVEITSAHNIFSEAV